MNEGGESKLNTNINYLLEQFGISVNADSVIRTSYFKYLHPKEAYISNGVVSKGATIKCLTARLSGKCVLLLKW